MAAQLIHGGAADRKVSKCPDVLPQISASAPPEVLG